MLTLAIDTATDDGSVALAESGVAKSVRNFSERTHAARTVACIDEVLGDAGALMADVKRVVVGDGPGSFTGIRIGFATAFGLRKANPSLELVTIPSMAAVAFGVSRSRTGQVAALFDAMRGEVFAAIYDFTSEGVTEVLEPSLWSLEELASSFPSVCAASWEGSVEIGEAVRRWTGQAPIAIDVQKPTACGLLDLAHKNLLLQAVGAAVNFKPNYGRLPAAQDKWEKENERELPHQGG